MTCLLHASGCGVNTVTGSRIVGGQPADPKEWPGMGALLRDRDRHFCGGVLITDLHVLTAAHCVHRLVEVFYVHSTGGCSQFPLLGLCRSSITVVATSVILPSATMRLTLFSSVECLQWLVPHVMPKYSVTLKVASDHSQATMRSCQREINSEHVTHLNAVAGVKT